MPSCHFLFIVYFLLLFYSDWKVEIHVGSWGDGILITRWRIEKTTESCLGTYLPLVSNTKDATVSIENKTFLGIRNQLMAFMHVVCAIRG